jgi:hypothetical protein
VILKVDWRIEQRVHRVADDFVDHAAMLYHDSRHALEI